MPSTFRLALASLLCAPAMLTAQTSTRPATPSAAVSQFMHAVADSNLERMAELFGTRNGSAVRTRMPDYQRRMIIMQSMLRGVQVRTLSDVPAPKGNGRTVTATLSHNGCSVTLPVNVVQSKNEGWLVEEFDLAQATKINQPCEGSHGGNDLP